MGTKVRVLASALTISAGVLVGTAMKEGYRNEAYPDPATNGAPWTIGFGETKGVRRGDRTDPIRALIQLNESLDSHARGVAECVRVPLSQGEFDASVDLAYNIGVGAFCASSVASRFNSGDYWGGCMSILRFTRGRVNGVLRDLPGLVTRRWANYETCVA